MRLPGILLMIGCASLLPACAGIHGIKGNDTGGVIPWTPETQAEASAIAAERCAAYDKYARIISNDAHFGGYIGYACVWSPYVRP